jgi:hypothetical protein
VKLCKLSEDDPGLLFCWHDRNLLIFIAAANQLNQLLIPRPTFIPVGPIDLESFKTNVVDQLSLCGGGNFGNTFVAPNSLQQFSNVNNRLRDIECHPFLQAAAAALPPGSFLGTTTIVTDNRTTARGTPRARVPPYAPLNQLFA